MTRRGLLAVVLGVTVALAPQTALTSSVADPPEPDWWQAAPPVRQELKTVEPELELEPEPEPELTVQERVFRRMDELGRAGEYDCLAYIFQRESSWRPDAIGDNGDSFGLGQRNAPAHGKPPWPWDVDDQVDWFLDYADARYGDACAAQRRWQERAEARNGRGWW